MPSPATEQPPERRAACTRQTLTGRGGLHETDTDGTMKKCASELELEAFIREHLAAAAERDDDHGRGGGATAANTGVFFSSSGGGGMPGLCSGDSNALELEGGDAGHPWWSDSVRTPHPAAVSTTTTALGSDQSDSDSESLVDVDGGRRFVRGRRSTETKRIRRMVSNRESARRSRRRKHAQLSDLESQVEQLRSESATLFKQLTEANQQFTTAVTDNRILKSDVETLRVKVKMAEDMVARSAASCGIGGQLGLAPLLSSRKMCQALDALRGTGDGGACFRGVTQGRQVQSSTSSLESMDNRLSTEVTSCAAADMWP